MSASIQYVYGPDRGVAIVVCKPHEGNNKSAHSSPITRETEQLHAR